MSGEANTSPKMKRESLTASNSRRIPLPTKERGSRWNQNAGNLEVTFPSPVKTASEINNTIHCEYYRPRG
jgi:hypothetical protein